MSSLCRAHVEGASDPEINVSVSEEPQRSHGRKEGAHPRAKSSSQARGARRPDKPLYMPRAAREGLSVQNLQEPSAEQASSTAAAFSTSSQPDPENTGCSTAKGHERLPTGPDSSPSRSTEQPLVLDESLSPFADLTLRQEETDQEVLPEKLDKDVMNEVSLQNSDPSHTH